MKSSKTLIYIAGYGRSGSTLLDILLNESERILSIGEFRFFPRHALENRIKCTCGQEFSNCPIWRSLLDNMQINDFRKELSRLRTVFMSNEGWTGFLRCLFPMKNEKELNEYRAHVCDLYSKLFFIAEGKHISESSKTAGGARSRPLLLNTICGFNVKIIHLIRDPRGVYYSSRRGNNEQLELGVMRKDRFTGIRTLLGWMFANIAGALNGILVGSANSIRIKYEDLVENPVSELMRLERFLSIDLSPVIAKIAKNEEIAPGHMVGGNRMARGSKIKISPDNKWQKSLPIWEANFYLVHALAVCSTL